MNRTSISIAALFLLILLLNLPGWIEQAPQQQNQDREQAWQPNYRAKRMLSTLYNQDGKINHEVFAEQMEHYELLGFTLFDNPQYTFYLENQPEPWRMNALEGTLYEDNRIQLETNVEIVNLNQQDFVQSITTSFIEIDLDDRTMSSDQPVVIQGKNFVINSNGFTADLATQQFELIDHVQTRYTPQR